MFKSIIPDTGVLVEDHTKLIGTRLGGVEHRWKLVLSTKQTTLMKRLLSHHIIKSVKGCAYKGLRVRAPTFSSTGLANMVEALWRRQ